MNGWILSNNLPYRFLQSTIIWWKILKIAICLKWYASLSAIIIWWMIKLMEPSWRKVKKRPKKSQKHLIPNYRIFFFQNQASSVFLWHCSLSLCKKLIKYLERFSSYGVSDDRPHYIGPSLCGSNKCRVHRQGVKCFRGPTYHDFSRIIMAFF